MRDSQRQGLLARIWKGDIRLPVAFWLVGVVLSMVVGTAVGLTGAVNAWPPLAMDLMLLPVTAFQVVAIWRSAAKYTGPPAWRNLAQIFVILGVLATAATVGLDAMN